MEDPQNEETPHNKRAARAMRVRQTLIGFGAGIGGLLLLCWMWWGALNQNPVMNIPTPVMPKPNARDYFVEAINLLVDGDKASLAINRRHTGIKGDRPYSLAERLAIVNENAPCLNALHEGFNYLYQEIPARTLGQTDVFSPMAKERSLARFLLMAARTRAEQGDWYGALDYQMDAMQLGQMMPRGGPLIGMLVGVAIRAIGGVNAGAAVGHLNAQQARAAARRMERIIALHVPFADVLQEEEWTQQSYLLAMFRDPKWHQSLKEMTSPSDEEGEDKRGAVEKIKEEVNLYLVNKHEVLYNYTRYMNQIVANARLPYASHTPQLPVPGDPVCQAIVLGGTMGRDKDVQMQAQEAQLCIRLAVQAYRMEHHKYPPTLNVLVPAYLSRLPDDPYALSGSYGYVLAGDGYSLTSANAGLPNRAGTP